MEHCVDRINEELLWKQVDVVLCIVTCAVIVTCRGVLYNRFPDGLSEPSNSMCLQMYCGTRSALHYWVVETNCILQYCKCITHCL